METVDLVNKFDVIVERILDNHLETLSKCARSSSLISSSVLIRLLPLHRSRKVIRMPRTFPKTQHFESP